jgi:S-adenosylmethionine-dependent methyltransferase
MLAIARQKAEKIDRGLMERIGLCHASVDEIPNHFSPSCFDLVLCHTLLEYVSEPWKTLETLVTALRPGGLISVLVVNAHASPLRWALAKGDLEKARLALDGQASSADLFGLPRHSFTGKATHNAMARLGTAVIAEYGIRIFADYLPVEKLTDPEFYAHLWDLEIAASPFFPYKHIARYIQFLARKSEIQ